MNNLKTSIENKTIYTGNIFKGIDKVVSKDLLRPQFCVAIIENGCIVATNAHILIKIPLSFWGIVDKEDLNNLEGKYIEYDTLKSLGTLNKSQEFIITKDGFTLLNKNLKPTLTYILQNDIKTDLGTFPNYEAVIPTAPADVSQIGFNPLLLVDLYNVYKHNKVGLLEQKTYLKFYGENKAMILTDNKFSGFVGLIMPTKID